MLDFRASRIDIRVKNDPDDFIPYRHQTQAWNDLSRHFTGDGKKAGFVVVPTGGGKTLIAARWLLINHISSGGRVFWLAHRRELLRQARKAFADHAHLAAHTLERMALAIVSSQDLSWGSVSKVVNAVFSMLHTAAVPRNRKYIDLLLDQSPNSPLKKGQKISSDITQG